MNLEWSAVTLAGHVALILSVLLILRNALIVRRSIKADMPLSMFAALVEPVVFFLTALCVERGYYVAARAMKDQGVNLWEAHPSPEVLSFVLALMAFWVAVAVFRVGGFAGSEFKRQVSIDGAVIVTVFSGLAWGLW